MPIQNVVDFIIYVAPGFLASVIYYAAYPVKQRTAFTQLAQSVVGGAIIVSLIRWLDTHYLGNLLHSSLPGTPDIRFMIAIVLGGVIAGNLAVFQLSARRGLASRFRLLSWLSSFPDSSWQFVNRPNVGDWAVVYLNDGAIYLGWITRYRFDPDSQDQDFLLANAKRVNDRLKTMYPVDGIGVYLNTRDVTRIEFIRPSDGEGNQRKKKPAA